MKTHFIIALTALVAACALPFGEAFGGWEALVAALNMGSAIYGAGLCAWIWTPEKHRSALVFSAELLASLCGLASLAFVFGL